MLYCDRRYAEELCRVNKIDWTQLQACVVQEQGEFLIIDNSRLNLPPDQVVPAPAPPSAPAPGTELSNLLARWFGITYTPTCACGDRSRLMNQWGPEECERRIDEIVGWMRQEARTRNLLFSDIVARQLVRLAIRRSKAK